MSKEENSEQFDADIQQCRKDILRLRDIIPGSDPPKKQKRPEKPSKQTDAAPIKTLKTEERKTEIPKFDLAEKIMAEHRKATSTKRKRPGQEMKPQIKVKSQKAKAEPIRRTIERPKSSEEDKIISEIVARDIAKLCLGD